MDDATLYVTAQGSRLGRIGERLVVRSREGRIIGDVPFFRVRQIICVGTVEIGHSALAALLKRDIDVALLTVNGRFKGRLSNLQPRAVRCRMKQYERASDTAFRLDTAKALVRGKLTSSRVWLMRQNRAHDDALARAVLGVTSAQRAVDAAKTTDELMGIEGNGAKCHFQGIRAVLRQDLGFAGRATRPPPDPVNAMLSFGYTLLFNRVWSAVEQAGLDPMLSNLHAIEDRRPSLALDLMEEFRVIVVDPVVCGMINRLELDVTGFRLEEGKGIRMSEETIGRFVKKLQSRFADTCACPVDGRSYSYGDLIVRQAWQYKNLVLGERSEYIPVAIK